MKAVGGLLIGFGLFWLVFALSMDTTVLVPGGGQVHNIGLMEARRTQMMLCAGMIVVGTLLMGFGSMARRDDDEDAIDDDERHCPYCAEPVRVEAIYCRHCKRDIPAVGVDEPGLELDHSPPDATTTIEDQGASYSYQELRDAAEAAEAGAAGNDSRSGA